MLNFIINMIELSRKRLHGWNYRVVADLEDCIPQQRRGAQGLCDQSRGAPVWEIMDTAARPRRSEPLWPEPWRSSKFLYFDYLFDNWLIFN